jgi:hypothetical protein
MNNPEGLALKSEGSYVQEELQLGGGLKIEVIAMNAVGTAVFVVDVAAAMTAGEKRPYQRECLGKNTKMNVASRRCHGRQGHGQKATKYGVPKACLRYGAQLK